MQTETFNHIAVVEGFDVDLGSKFDVCQKLQCGLSVCDTDAVLSQQ